MATFQNVAHRIDFIPFTAVWETLGATEGGSRRKLTSVNPIVFTPRTPSMPISDKKCSKAMKILVIGHNKQLFEYTDTPFMIDAIIFTICRSHKYKNEIKCIISCSKIDSSFFLDVSI